MTTGGDMARQSQNKFAKRQKEIERKRKADEKMARRHEKKNRAMEGATPETDQSPTDLADSNQQATNCPPPADGPQGIQEFRHEKENNEF